MLGIDESMFEHDDYNKNLNPLTALIIIVVYVVILALLGYCFRKNEISAGKKTM